MEKGRGDAERFFSYDVDEGRKSVTYKNTFKEMEMLCRYLEKTTSKKLLMNSWKSIHR